MEFQVEWANNPEYFHDIEDWNCVTIKHLNPKIRKCLNDILIMLYKENKIVPMKYESSIIDTKSKNLSVTDNDQYWLAFDTIFFQYFLMENTEYGIRAIRIADLTRFDLMGIVKTTLNN